MSGGVTGKAGDSLPMSISSPSYSSPRGSRSRAARALSVPPAHRPPGDGNLFKSLPPANFRHLPRQATAPRAVKRANPSIRPHGEWPPACYLVNRLAMKMYQHDSAASFEFVLSGNLTGDRVADLEHAWITARSVLERKELVVDVSGLTEADPFGLDLLARMRESGARLTATLPPESRELLQFLGIRAAAPSDQFSRNRILRFFRFAAAR